MIMMMKMGVGGGGGGGGRRGLMAGVFLFSWPLCLTDSQHHLDFPFDIG